jgi:hypothetical protein
MEQLIRRKNAYRGDNQPNALEIEWKMNFKKSKSEKRAKRKPFFNAEQRVWNWTEQK